jgi:diguanylate cyclase (GGDEF)-like protein/PAS domain S-box-containing protein
MRQYLTVKNLLWITAGALLVSFIGIRLAPDRGWIVFFDNLHWTVAYITASALAWLGVQTSAGRERATRFWFFLGLSAVAFGQILWDLQVYHDWNPFPAPSDAFYLMLGVGCMIGLAKLLEGTLPESSRKVLVIDTAMLASSILAVTLTLYLPHSDSVSPFQLIVLSAYPVLLLTASCFTALTVLYLRARPQWPWVLFLATLITEGIVWMVWNNLTLKNALEDGSLYNMSFSVAGPLLGFAAMHWRITSSDDLQYQKRCEGILRLIPLLSVIAAALSVVLTILEDVLPSVRISVLLASAVILVLAFLRQTLLLSEHVQLLVAEQALKENQQKLDVILNNLSAYIYMKDTEGRYLYANQQVCDLWNATLKEVIGATDEKFFDAATAANIRANDMRVLAGGETLRTEETNTVEGSGKTFTYWSIKLPLRHEDGHIFALLGISTDITERKAIERKLIESETTLRTIIDSEPECVKLTAQDGTLLQMNRAGLDMIEADTAEQVVGQQVLNLILPEYHSAYINLTESVFRGNSETLEFEIQGLKGKRRWMDTHAVPMRDAQGNITALLGLTRDVSDRKKAEIALRENEARFRFLLDSSPIAVRIAKKCGREVAYANPAYAALINTGAEPALGADPKNYYANQQDYEDILAQLARGEHINNRLVELNIPGQGTKWALASYVPTEFQGEPAVLGWFYDITDRKLAEERLLLFAQVFAEAHEGISITDAAGDFIDVNPAFCDITGYSREEILGHNPRILNSGKQSPEFFTAMWDALKEHGHWQGEIWNRKKNGEIFAELLTISALRDDLGRTLHYVGLFSDITDSKHQQQALEHMAHFDMLTKLPNRVLFADRFHQAIARAKRDDLMLALCYLDLDGFKQVNDTLGHEAGDQLLVEVAERIKSSLREEDTVSRLGGDEFAMLMGSISSVGECEQALERIHRIISQPYLIFGQSISIAASTGVTLFPLDDADPDALLRHADQAMYQAKQDGRNRYHLFDAAQDQQVQIHRQQMIAIEEAFSRNEFCLHYQPKVHMTSGKVIGVEALIRWNHPERGIIPPIEFLPVVKDGPLDPIMGNWVIEQALQQLELWHKQGLDLQVSVNISPFHLQQHDFFAKLDAALARHPDIPSNLLQLEILESSVMSDITDISNVLKACRDALGVSIALDDFGTGYSSLAYLRRLPANTVKIDQSFVRDMIDDPNDYAIVEGVMGLTSAFHREVIAEGVETREHGLMLLIMGCNLAQGYGIARPMPPENIERWVMSYRPYAKWQDYPHHPLSPRESKILLLIIESNSWINRMEECLTAEPGTRIHWPIMLHEKCHCGQWISQAQQENLFDPASLAEFENAHTELHVIGNRLMQLYLSGNITEAREGLEQLRAVHHGIETIINNFN